MLPVLGTGAEITPVLGSMHRSVLFIFLSLKIQRFVPMAGRAEGAEETLGRRAAAREYVNCHLFRAKNSNKS